MQAHRRNDFYDQADTGYILQRYDPTLIRDYTTVLYDRRREIIDNDSYPVMNDPD